MRHAKVKCFLSIKSQLKCGVLCGLVSHSKNKKNADNRFARETRVPHSNLVHDSCTRIEYGIFVSMQTPYKHFLISGAERSLVLLNKISHLS